MQLLLLGHLLVLYALKTHSDPVLGLFVSDMHKFNADLAAIGIFVGLNEVLKFPDALLFANSSLVL